MEERKTAAAEATTAKPTDDAKVLRNTESAKNSKVNPQNTNRISMIGDDLARGKNQLEEIANVGTTQTDDIFIVKSANQAMQDAKAIPDPKPLWLSLWNESEICCLFADLGVGKAIYTVQMGASHNHSIQQGQGYNFF